jgi:hypothetical protein
MTQPTVQAQSASAVAPQSSSLGFFGRVVGVIVSPKETFGHIARDPRPFAMLAFVSLVAAVGTAIFFRTEVGQLAWLDAAVRQREAFGAEVDDTQYAAMERIAGFMGYIVPVYSLVVGPLVTMILAGIIKAAFAIISGAEATFKQTLGVVAASGVVVLVQQCFVLPLNYFRETMTSATSLGAFLPMLPENSFPARFLGTIDLFLVWWVMVLAIGLGVLFRRPTRTIALTLFGIYLIIALAVATVTTMAGGS